MPKLGEIRYGRDLGRTKSDRESRQRFMWIACPMCRRERWVRYSNGSPQSFICKYCAKLGWAMPEEAKRKIRQTLKGRTREQCHNWKGGRFKTKVGYIKVYLSKEDEFFHHMIGDRNYVLEHRLVIAKHLGRCLHSWEVVHHKNGVKDDNRIENLELTVFESHSKDHSKGYRDGYQKGLTDGRLKQIQTLKDRIAELESQVVSPDDATLRVGDEVNTKKDGRLL